MTVLALRWKSKEAPLALADVAAAIEKPEELLLAEAVREQLEERRADLRKRLDAARDEFERFGSGGKGFAAMLDEERTLGDAIEANRRELLSARRAYGGDVATALQPTAEAAARQFLAALADADAAVTIIAEIEKIRATAECRAAYPLGRLDATYIASHCRRVLAAASSSKGISAK